jgi:predicted dehydrogenase
MSAIRTVVVGIGGRGLWAASAFHESEDFEVVGLIDAIRPKAELFAADKQLKNVAIFEDVASCLAGLKFDALAVFTPDGTHAGLVVPALDAGKHVFVEKPLEVTEDKLRAIVDADARAGGRTFVGLNLRYAPLYRKVHELIQSGVLGRVLTIQADEFYDGGRTYFRRWNRLRDKGGGLWITKACHDFDLLHWLADAAPLRVYAEASLDYYTPRQDAAMYCRDCKLLDDCPDRYAPAADPELLKKPKTLGYRLNELHEQITGNKPDLCLFNSDKETFDHGIAMVSFANQAFGTYTLNVVAGFTDRRIRVGGTKATVEGELTSATLRLRHRDPARSETIPLTDEGGGHGGGDLQLLGAFAAFVRGEPTAFVAPHEAAVPVRMGLAATRSSDQNCVVTMVPGDD